MKYRCAGLALAVVGLCLGYGRGENPDKEKQPVDDATFVKMASQANLAEINMGKLALKQASGSAVKKYAQRLLDDHTKANKELNQLADKKQWTPAQSMDEKHRAMAEKMGQLEGKEFDTAFLKHMIQGHEKVIALFQSEAKNGQDPDLKAWANQTLPTLKEHLKMARDISGDRGGDKEGDQQRKDR